MLFRGVRHLLTAPFVAVPRSAPSCFGRCLSVSAVDSGAGTGVDAGATASAGASSASTPPSLATGRGGLPAANEKPVLVLDVSGLRTANEHINVAAMKPREVRCDRGWRVGVVVAVGSEGGSGGCVGSERHLRGVGPRVCL